MRRLALLPALFVALGADPGLPTVEPADLVGREIATEDRVRLFQLHKGQGYDELYLKRTPVVFRLPRRLRPEHPPSNRVMGVRGVLGRDGDRWFCDVTALEPLPDDIDRLNQGVANLRPRDYATRLRWAQWAAKRAHDFDDRPLAQRAREVEAQALREEADTAAADSGEATLALAQRARSRGIPEPEPSALAHRGFRKLAAEAKTPKALNDLRGRIEAFFPKAAQPLTDPADLSRWDAPYANDPGGAYRTAPPEARAALDRRLWADIAERAFTAEADADPAQAIALAGKARAELPDRPQLATRLLDLGIKTATASPLQLRQAEVNTLAKLCREQLHDPERAHAILRGWLGARQKALRRQDAEGRLNLASQYEALLNDRGTAMELLYEAYKIDPHSEEVSQAFLLRGCKKNARGDWVDPQAERAAAEPATESRRTAASDQKLRGATEDEVRLRLGGRPNRVARVATRGQAVEQWIYYNGNQVLYVNFARAPSDSRPRVIAFYSRRRSAAEAPTAP